MIKRCVFDKIGLLDEGFGIGFGEDIDFCIRAKRAGYKIGDICPQRVLEGKQYVFDFPIYHIGGKTVHQIPGWEAQVKENQDILKNRYGEKHDFVSVLKNVDGFFTEHDALMYRNLVDGIKNGIIVEIGSYLGTSALCVADICRKNGNKIYCVDTWNGSEEHQKGEGACLCDPKLLYQSFCENIQNYGYEDVVVPVRMDSVSAAKKFIAEKTKVDMVFIDGDHSYKSVSKDITMWEKTLVKDGVVSGHDIMWDSVKRSVLERYEINVYGNIWVKKRKKKRKEKIKVTAVIPTKGRYFSTLPSAILSVINQTYPIYELILYDDGEHRDLRNDSIYQNLFNLLDVKCIKWEMIFSPGQGQVWSHNHSTTHSGGDWIWRLDDDNFAESNVLEILVSNIKDGVGAVGGLVLDPKESMPLPKDVSSNKIQTVFTSPNLQWFPQKGKKNVEHLYSTFLYRKEASSHGYCEDLSPAGHREETIFTYEMKRSGWDLIVDPRAITWHLREPSGGTRSHQDQSFWEHDEIIFSQKMIKWGISNDPFYIVLDCGMGDHIALLSVLPELKEKYDNIVIAACYPEIFENESIKIISIEKAKKTLVSDLKEFNIYKKMTDWRWTKHICDAFRKMYL